MSEVLDYIQLSELAEISMGQSPDSSFCNSDEKGLPFLQGCAEFGRINPSFNTYCFPPLRRSKPDSLLISVRAPVGKLNWSDQEYCIGRGLGSIKAKQTTANTQFLKYAIEVGINFLYRRSQGSTFLAIGAIDLHEFPIPNFSLPQQRKIAKILKTIDQTIESTQALIEKYQLIKAGLMHDLFTRGIGADGKLRPPREEAPELYQETAIGWIPKEWTIHRINDLAAPYKGSTTIGPFGSDLVMTDYRNEGCPIVFVRDVKESGFNWVSNVFVSDRKAQRLFAHRVNSGDILATKMGLPPCIACVYPDDMPMGIITADLIRMTVDEKKVIPRWLSSAINHDRIVRQVAAITAGVTRPKVTLEDFRKLKVALPGMGEQIAINSMLGNQHNLLASEEKKLEKLRKQKAGLMHDLLTGKVQVKVDNEDSDKAIWHKHLLEKYL